MERSLIHGILVGSAPCRATQSPVQVGNMVRMVNEFGSTAKGLCFWDSANHVINWVLVMNIMQIRSATFAMLVHKEDLVVGIEANDAVLRVETGCKTHANMIANHDRVTHMQVSHGSERRFRAACTGHANIQSGKGPCTLQGFQGDVTHIST